MRILLATMTTVACIGAAAAQEPMVDAMDQSVANGIVSAEKVVAAENGWLVVHRTDTPKRPLRSVFMSDVTKAPPSMMSSCLPPVRHKSPP